MNIAAALAQTGAKVGLLDGDVYGPSIPIMMGVQRELATTDDGHMIPHEAHGVRFISMGYFAPGDKPLIWRGPMATKALQQCLLNVEWGELDYLLIDLPPGTGDVHLTVVQTVPLTGGVIVSTPQDVGVTIAMKTLRMFQQTSVPILGIIENMSYYLCAGCGRREEIFGHGQVAKASEGLGISFLGEVPLDPLIRAQADSGTPIVISHPETASATAYRNIAELLAAQVSIQNYSESEVTGCRPLDVKPSSPTELTIAWDDGHVSTYLFRHLREECPCAMCVDEWTHEKRLDPASVPDDIHSLNISPVGNYGIRFNWSDGHNTGLYKFDRLREMCRCAVCASRKG